MGRLWVLAVIAAVVIVLIELLRARHLRNADRAAHRSAVRVVDDEPGRADGADDSWPALIEEFRLETADFIFAKAIPDDAIVQLVDPSRLESGRRLREAWARVIDDEACWPPRYLAYYDVLAKGRRFRLSRHQKLLEALALRVVRRAYAADRLRNIFAEARAGLGEIVVFNRHHDDCPRVASKLRFWQINDAAWPKIYPPCERIDCGCSMRLVGPDGVRELKQLVDT